MLTDAMNRSPLPCMLPVRRMLAAFFLLILLPRPAEALFFSTSRALRSADAKMEEGIKAEEEGRRQDALDAFNAAVMAYADIRKDHPDVQVEHITSQMADCRRRMVALFSDAEAANEAGEEAWKASLPPAEAQVGELPQNQVHRPLPAARKTEQTDAVTMPTTSASTSLPPESAPLEERIDFYLKANRAAEAVVELDNLMGGEPEKATPFQRLLLGRALVASGNYARAILILDPLAKEQPSNPAVLTLAAGAHLAQGNAFSALQHLDTLVREHPQYADAYVNLAYTRFAMDPEANRDEAILYYKHALARGAARDRKLEAELDVQIEP